MSNFEISHDERLTRLAPPCDLMDMKDYQKTSCSAYVGFRCKNYHRRGLWVKVLRIIDDSEANPTVKCHTPGGELELAEGKALMFLRRGHVTQEELLELSEILRTRPG